MQWWCSAGTLPWEWSWRPYAGVWALALLLAWALTRAFRAAGSSEGRGPERGRPATAGVGVLLLWIGLDWPVGALGGYLASAHMVQFLLVALLSPALLLLGIPDPVWRRLRERHPGLARAAGRATRPLAALLIFNAVLVSTHVPAVVDALMATQLGAFAINASWFAAGTAFRWPVVGPPPERRRLGAPLEMGYLFLNTIPMSVVAAFLVLAELPLYATYELAPPVDWMPTRVDQQVAGILMKAGGGAIHWVAIGVIFFRWWRSEEEGGARRRLSAAAPRSRDTPAPGRRRA